MISIDIAHVTFGTVLEGMAKFSAKISVGFIIMVGSFSWVGSILKDLSKKLVISYDAIKLKTAPSTCNLIYKYQS